MTNRFGIFIYRSMKGFLLMVMGMFPEEAVLFLGEKVGNLIKSNESPHRIHGRAAKIQTIQKSIGAMCLPFMDSAHKDDLGTSCP